MKNKKEYIENRLIEYRKEYERLQNENGGSTKRIEEIEALAILIDKLELSLNGGLTNEQNPVHERNETYCKT